MTLFGPACQGAEGLVDPFHRAIAIGLRHTTAGRDGHQGQSAQVPRHCAPWVRLASRCATKPNWNARDVENRRDLVGNLRWIVKFQQGQRATVNRNRQGQHAARIGRAPWAIGGCLGLKLLTVGRREDSACPKGALSRVVVDDDTSIRSPFGAGDVQPGRNKAALCSSRHTQANPRARAQLLVQHGVQPG